MFRVVKFVKDLGEFVAGEIIEVESQIACDAIAQGFAVPCVDPVPVKSAPEVAAVPSAPEVA